MEFDIVDSFSRMSFIGWAVIVMLLLMSVLAFSVGLDRALAILRPRFVAKRFAGKVMTHLKAGDLDEAVAANQADGGPLGRVVSAGLTEFVAHREQAPNALDTVDLVRETLDQQIDTEVGQLRRGLGVLATIGSVAPFVGLFGTVIGIINSFAEIGRTGTSGLGAVSAGISEALIATALGILVAIPAVCLFNYFSTQLEAIESMLGDAATSVINGIRKAGWRQAWGEHERSPEPAE